MTDASIGGSPLAGQEAGLDEVLRLVLEREGIDLRLYRRKTIERRVTSRLQKLRCQSYSEYAARLANDPPESRHLLEHVTMKVSRFFRNARVFARLREEVLPDIIRRSTTGGKLRIWSAGCGNGEEAYSLAILIEEMARQGHQLAEATVWATDIDENALAVARRGVYSETALGETPPDLISTYFISAPARLGLRYEAPDSIRQRVSFSHHDLLSAQAVADGLPFDLVLCRNVLIYFAHPAQERALDLLTSSVTQGGYLCLGEAEQLTRMRQPTFEVVDRHARLYRKV
ncbi:MAG: protein-glutamate O-methyltransferase CheR [Chloroflexi bacterium]|nr:protein-glutamate O-methyltransferase CheR [Chloroflexota bacterium]